MNENDGAHSIRMSVYTHSTWVKENQNVICLMESTQCLKYRSLECVSLMHCTIITKPSVSMSIFPLSTRANIQLNSLIHFGRRVLTPCGPFVVLFRAVALANNFICIDNEMALVGWYTDMIQLLCKIHIFWRRKNEHEFCERYSCAEHRLLQKLNFSTILLC